MNDEEYISERKKTRKNNREKIKILNWLVKVQTQ